MYCYLGCALLLRLCFVTWDVHCYLGCALILGICIVTWGVYCYLGVENEMEMIEIWPKTASQLLVYTIQASS